MIENPVVARRVRARASAPRRPSPSMNRQPASKPRRGDRQEHEAGEDREPVEHDHVGEGELARRRCIHPLPCTVKPAATAKLVAATMPNTRALGFHWTSTSSTKALPRERGPARGRSRSRDLGGDQSLSLLHDNHVSQTTGSRRHVPGRRLDSVQDRLGRRRDLVQEQMPGRGR